MGEGSGELGGQEEEEAVMQGDGALAHYAAVDLGKGCFPGFYVFVAATEVFDLGVEFQSVEKFGVFIGHALSLKPLLELAGHGYMVA